MQYWWRDKTPRVTHRTTTDLNWREYNYEADGEIVLPAASDPVPELGGAGRLTVLPAGTDLGDRDVG
jgi:hypothetical protein